jgi:hypothetical protein
LEGYEWRQVKLDGEVQKMEQSRQVDENINGAIIRSLVRKARGCKLHHHAERNGPHTELPPVSKKENMRV